MATDTTLRPGELKDVLLKEIAAVTDRPLGTVKTQLHRGLARLRLAFEESER